MLTVTPSDPGIRSPCLGPSKKVKVENLGSNSSLGYDN